MERTKVNKLLDDIMRLPRPECYDSQWHDEYRDGVEQMLADLVRLAKDDGCIAAAWAVQAMNAVASSYIGYATLRAQLNQAVGLLRECRQSLSNGLETECETEMEYSQWDRKLIARVDHFLTTHPAPSDRSEG